MSSRRVVTLVALTATGAVLASVAPTHSGVEAASEQERLQPVSFAGHLGRSSRRRLPVVFSTGVCADALRFSALREGRRSVAVRFDEVFRGDAERVCPAIAAYRCFTVVLHTPLGRRRVVDAARGVTIRRLRSDEPAARQKSCPRLGRPPVDLAPSRLDGK
jgi:hypothetical protein